MKTERQIWKQSRHWLLATALLMTAGGGVLTSCSKYDLDEESPAGWGESIYSWLDTQGKYTNTVRLIDELGYREVLAKTGSKTLFVADDEAYQRFYGNNSWGVGSYEQLSEAQKKMLLFGSMIDNSIQMNSLSTIQGTPLREGQCLRRFSALSEYDTVPVLKPADMPSNIYWKRHRESGKEMVCMEDGSSVPMLLFLEQQMVNNRITNEDYNFLFNNTVSRQDGDASVNGVKVVEQNVRCANGFIHRTADVVTPLPNMAELIAQKPEVNLYYKLLERFCAPYPDSKDRAMTIQYNDLYGKDVDTVYTKRFFNDKRGVETKRTPDGGVIIDDNGHNLKPCLRFDPEWNAYYSASYKSANDGSAAEQRDMAVMLVPSNKAMEDYWNGIGKPLSENFASWDDVDDEVIIELLNLNMLPSFLSSVPSKFDGVLNDANDPMGLTTGDVDEVWMACNGAIYQTNKVFSPTAYVCVSFPALVSRNMKIINWAIKQCKYDNYLKALGTTYSFFLPDNDALLEYIDPCSYGKENLELLSFRWDDAKGVIADIYDYFPEIEGEGQRVFKSTTENYNRILSCLRDVLDTHIVMGSVWDGKHEYYRTKNGTGIRVTNPTDEAHMTVEGSYQMYEGKPLSISRVWDQRKEVTGGNGKTYVLSGQPLMGTRRTVRDQLADNPQYFGKFLELLEPSGLLETIHNLGTGKKEDNKACGGQNLSVFNTYHYTIYVPSNESIQELIDAGKLPTWDDVENKREAQDLAGATQDSIAIVSFLRYHIQDNALYLGAENESGEFETSLIDEEAHRFRILSSKLTDNEIEVKDAVDQKNGTTSHKVIKRTYTDENGIVKPLYNIQAREYLYNGDDAKTATELYTTSSAVIHLIDRPLQYDAAQ